VIVIRYGEDKLERAPEASLTLGTFDGVHLGHFDLLTELTRGEMPTVVTFEPHPQHVLMNHPDRLQLLSPITEKLRKLERAGVARTVILPFTRELASLSAMDFLRELLIGEIGMKKLVVGFNHSFGRGREGTIKFMKDHSSELGYELTIVESHDELGRSVSSTRIRQAIAAGDLRIANHFLTSPYRTPARVVRGEGRGQALGYPTANLEFYSADQLIPAEGVYAVRVILEEELVDGVASIGRKETFGEYPLSIEVHLFDRKIDLYDRSISVIWIDYLRNQEVFASGEELTAQMDRDSAMAKQALSEADERGLLPIPEAEQKRNGKRT